MSNIGRVIYGSCGGFFDSYYPKRIEAEGVDWIIARCIDEMDVTPECATFDGDLQIERKQSLIDEWAKKPVGSVW